MATETTNLVLSDQELSIWGLFLQADIIVKLVILLLVVASIWSWSIIIDKIRTLRLQNALADEFEDVFWSGEHIDRIYDRLGGQPDGIMASVFVAAMREWRRVSGKAIRQPGQIVSSANRIDRNMEVTMSREMEQMEKGMTFLASVGSVAPFVGLFGTVWGIMNSFQAIAISKNTSLAVVAPGIAEALFATALGLVAAIPAVVAYNRFNARIDALGARVDRFSGEFSSMLSRQLEEG
ncbi:MAG: protein TolQ [Candidatus Puniceispirillales bacterium]|nr:protein TolQ [Pseudomonadota bacterium]